MTLLIASIRTADVTLTADGRCTHRAPGRPATFEDDYQKLHPVPDHPIAIAHHGENMLDNKPVKELLASFFKNLNAGNHTMREIADLLREYAHAAVRTRLHAVGRGAAAGFWVVGFSPARKEPAGVEIFWKDEGDHLAYEEREARPTAFITGGDGKYQIPQTSWKEIENRPQRDVHALHQKLMTTAINAAMKENPVGGHVHELLITPEKWEWTVKPEEKG